MLTSTLEWEQVQALRAVIPHHVVHRTLASETVLLNIETGHYYGMDEVGGRFFTALRDSRNVGTAVDLLIREFEAPPEQIRADMLRYCGELVEHGLVVLQEAGLGPRKA